MKFRRKEMAWEFEAFRWFKNGDHPEDGDRAQEGRVVRYYRSPDLNGETPCGHCGELLHKHGWIEGGHVVCPGDWVITGVTGLRYPCKPSALEAYEPVQDGAP
jgi:hypothetical protein